MTPVISDIAGVVATFLVEDGASVDKGERIMDIECMKSFFPVEAPAAGIVHFKVELGEAVGQDEVVAQIEG